MPVTGDIITAQSYNDLQTSVYNILGNGSGQNGYGKSLVSTPVNVGDDITGAKWASLKVDILTAAQHQGIASGANIANLPTPGTNGDFFISATDLGLFQLATTEIANNKFLLGAGQYSDENLLNAANAPISNTRTASWGGSTKPTVTHAFTVTFNNAAAARYFFNAGSSLRFTASFNGSPTSQNRAWNKLLTSIGVVVFDHSATTASGGTGSAIGFYTLTDTPQTVFIASGAGVYGVASPYSTNDYVVKMSCNVPNNSQGGATQIFVTINFDDFHSGSYLKDVVNGTLTSNVLIRRASGSNVNEAAPRGTNHILLDGYTY